MLRTDAGPEDPPAQKREQRGNQRDRNDERDGRREREGRPERPEELELSDEESSRARDDDQPGGGDDRRHSDRRRARSFDAVQALEEAPAAAGEVEDRVVGDYPEGERNDERFHLLRHRHSEALSDPGNDPTGDDESDAGREEGHQGRAQGPEGKPDDEEDQRDRGDLDELEVAVDLEELLVTGGRRPRNADERLVGPVDPRRVDVRLADAVHETRLRPEGEVGEDGRPALARSREQAERVRDRKRERDSFGILAALRHGDRARERTGLRLRRDTARISLDDNGVRSQRQAEELGLPLSDAECRRVAGDEPAESEGLSAAEAREEECARCGRGDPRGQDGPAQAHDSTGEEPNEDVASHSGSLPRPGDLEACVCSPPRQRILETTQAESHVQALIPRQRVSRTSAAPAADRRDYRRVHGRTGSG